MRLTWVWSGGGSGRQGCIGLVYSLGLADWIFGFICLIFWDLVVGKFRTRDF